MKYKTFEDWYNEIEGFSLRGERLTAPVEELQAAFEAGQSSVCIQLEELHKQVKKLMIMHGMPIKQCRSLQTPQEVADFRNQIGDAKTDNK